MFLVVCYQWLKRVLHNMRTQYAHNMHNMHNMKTICTLHKLRCKLIICCPGNRSTYNRHQKQHHLFLFGVFQLKDYSFQNFARLLLSSRRRKKGDDGDVDEDGGDDDDDDINLHSGVVRLLDASHQAECQASTQSPTSAQSKDAPAMSLSLTS